MAQEVAQPTTQSSKYRRRWWTLGVLAFSLIVFGLDNMVLQVAIPTLQRELDATSSQLIWMIDAYIVVFASLLLVTGTLGDRYGRKLMIQLGLAVFCVSSLTAAYAGSGVQLIAARAIMGIGAALVVTSSLSILTDVFPEKSVVRRLGYGRGSTPWASPSDRWWEAYCWSTTGGGPYSS